jgi:hypothetical protein
MAKRNARSRKRQPGRKTGRRSAASAATSRAKGRRKTTVKAATRRKASPKRKVKASARKSAQKTRSTRGRRAAVRNARPRPAALSRQRRVLQEEEVMVPSPPSTLNYSPKASGAESGHEMYNLRKRQHSQGDTKLTGGDVDADWNEAYASGEEAPGGDMPTPDQDVVEEIGRALGVEYEDAEELKGSEKIEERDRHRWEYDPASAEDYRDRNKKE